MEPGGLEYVIFWTIWTPDPREEKQKQPRLLEIEVPWGVEPRDLECQKMS